MGRVRSGARLHRDPLGIGKNPSEQSSWQRERHQRMRRQHFSEILKVE